jgi:hypothetical protein
MLKRITTQDVEPTDLDVVLAPRLNLLAGDNGLGKTFLLDLAWWTLTGMWAQRPAIPRRGEGVDPKIRGEIDGSPLIAGAFDFHSQSWNRIGPNRSPVDPFTHQPLSRFEPDSTRLHA